MVRVVRVMEVVRLMRVVRLMGVVHLMVHQTSSLANLSISHTFILSQPFHH